MIVRSSSFSMGWNRALARNPFASSCDGFHAGATTSANDASADE